MAEIEEEEEEEEVEGQSGSRVLRRGSFPLTDPICRHYMISPHNLSLYINLCSVSDFGAEPQGLYFVPLVKRIRK